MFYLYFKLKLVVSQIFRSCLQLGLLIIIFYFLLAPEQLRAGGERRHARGWAEEATQAHEPHGLAV